MRSDLNTYDNMSVNDPNKNLEFLVNMMKRHIDKGQEKKLYQQRENFKAMRCYE